MTEKEFKEFEETIKLAEIGIANLKKECVLIEAQTIGFLIGFTISLIINVIRIQKRLNK